MKPNIQEGNTKIKRSKWGTVITVLLGLWLLSFAIAYIMAGNSTPVVRENKIVLIPIEGMISSDGGSGSFFSGATATSSAIVDYLNQAGKDDSIKGVVLEINSGGGTVVASKEIETAVKSLKGKKPVVAWIREVGASGAYWIASASDKIVADPMSITGSIGVSSSYLEYTGLMEKYGIGYEQMISGKYKDAGSPFRDLKDEERDILQKKLDRIHEAFIRTVAENRNLPESKVEKVSDGMFYLGEEFYDLGFVDYLGGKELAVNVTKQMAKMEDAKLVKFEKKTGLLDVLSKLSAEAFYSMGRGIGAELQDRSKVSKNLEVVA
ncbi:signal peptide peptidase SppA [Candidatus Woesearchaeota archaeon]|nr:signal peptide peptidase SppA [Candidatus Woesearchaeota archaeon]